MKSTGNRRVLIALVFFALLAATLILVGPAEEAVAASNCTYYSNASHNTVVGQFGYDCCNNRVAWGVKTAYKTCGGCFPCFPPPR